MSPAVLDRPRTGAAGVAAPASPAATASAASALVTGRAGGTQSGGAQAASAQTGDGGPTLEGVIVRAWEGLAAHRGVGCPVCGGRMAPRYGASGVAPVGGRCTDCGTTLG